MDFSEPQRESFKYKQVKVHDPFRITSAKK